MTIGEAIEKHLCCPYDHAPLTVVWKEPDARGRIFCSQCRREWAVEEGIPSLMPDYYYRPAEVRPAVENAADCLSELATRDRQATVYESLFSTEETEIETAATLREWRVRATDVVAELGVGTGRMLSYASRCAAVIGCDYSLDSLKQARRKGLGNLILVQADVTLLPLRDDSVDAMLSVGVFQHLPSQALRRRHLEECWRCLRAGGEYLMSGVYNFRLQDRLRDIRTVYTKDDVHGGADGKTGYHTENRIYYYNFDIRELRREGVRCFEVLDAFGFLVDIGRVGKVLAFLLGADRADRLWQRTVFGRWFGRLLLMRMRKGIGPLHSPRPAFPMVAAGAADRGGMA